MNDEKPALHHRLCRLMFGPHHAHIPDERKRRVISRSQEPDIRALARAAVERDLATPPMRTRAVPSVDPATGLTIGWATVTEPTPPEELNTLSHPQSVADLKALIAADPVHEPKGFTRHEAGAFAHEYEKRRRELTGG